MTCISCIDPNSVLNSSQLCECKPGYYFSNGICTLCNIECKTCISASICIECAKQNSYFNGTTCVCKDGFYLDYNCLPCPNNCTKCLNLNECSKCLDPNSILINSICECKQGYYLDSTQFNCSPCNETCLSCSSKTSCSSCKVLNSILSQSSTCECMPGYYQPSFPLDSCLPCLPLCKTCSSNIVCLTCTENSFLNSLNLCNCNPNFYYSKDTCIKCPVQCELCTDSSLCITCKYLNSNPPLCECSQGFYSKYVDSVFSFCEKCHDDCSSCSDPFKCDECKDPNSVIDELGCKCIDGYWRDQNSLEIKCYECNDKCLSCDFEKCISCKDSNSDIEKNCECNPGYLEKIGKNGFELCEYHPLKCNNDEYYEIGNNSCVKCPDICVSGCQNSSLCNECYASNCLYCVINNPQICIECKTKYELKNSLCQKCNESNYYNSSTKSCNSCPTLCISCSSDSNCLRCEKSSIAINGRCLCNAGYRLEEKCIRNYFNASIYLSWDNKVKIKFDEELENDLRKEDLNIMIDKDGIDFEIKKIDYKLYSILFEIDDFKDSSILFINFTHEMQSVNNSLLYFDYFRQVIFVTNEMATAKMMKLKIENAKDYGSKGTTSTFSIAFVLAVLNFDFSFAGDFFETKTN